MKRTLRTLVPLGGLLVLLLAFSGSGQSQGPAPVDAPEKKFPDFNTVVKGAKVYDGLFTLHHKDEHVLAEIQPYQFDKPFLVPMAIAKGAGVGGTTLNFGEEWVIVFKKVGDKIFVVRRNVRFTAAFGSPAARALDTTYSDSVLLALPIKAINPIKGSVLIDFNQIFFGDFGDLNIGYLDRDRTTWHKVKAFKKNVELQVAATFNGNRTGNIASTGGDAVIDTRGATVVIHYGLVELPEPGYTSRPADDRVGHFNTVYKDFSKESSDTAFVRSVNRWRLERADGSPWKEGAKLVAPKKKIIYWIENSVPEEYRATVREGILEWNKAFEKIGFRDAIEVRQQEGEDFDPEDITYATFRWITSEVPYAIGPSRANPFTGELLDADILFDASMVRSYKGETAIYRDEKGQMVEPASNIQASRRGWDLPGHPLDRLKAQMGTGVSWNDKAPTPEAQMQAKLNAIRHGHCQCAHHKQSELALAMTALLAQVNLKDGEKIPDELLMQAIKETVMHEVGHTLGLRHNFKASTVLKSEQLHDTTITGKQGLVGSVMDYNPANVAPKGTKQGHYFSTTLGAYDYWAIEYAYTPNGDPANLAKIAGRAAEPQLVYATDEDLLGTNDPLTNQWDLGSDPLKFARERIQLSKDLLPNLAERVTEKGEGYQRARVAFGVLLKQYGNSAFLASKYVGATTINRDHKDDPNAREPVVPVAPAKQREALKFLQEQILTDAPFDFPPELLRKLGTDRWVHWGNEKSFLAQEFPLHERVLGIHRTVFNEILTGPTLLAIQNSAKLNGKDAKPVELSEVFRTFSDSAFADLPVDGKPSGVKSSVIRRNLQREYVRRLTNLILGSGFGSVPADARSLARFHLKEAKKRLEAAIKEEKDETAKAHFDELQEQIGKALAANLTAVE